MSRRKPFSLELGGHQIQVNWLKGLRKKLHCDGRYFPGQALIELDADLTDDNALETLIHELLHVVEDIHNINLGEKRVRLIGFSMHALLKPLLVRKL